MVARKRRMSVGSLGRDPEGQPRQNIRMDGTPIRSERHRYREAERNDNTDDWDNECLTQATVPRLAIVSEPSPPIDDEQHFPT